MPCAAASPARPQRHAPAPATTSRSNTLDVALPPLCVRCCCPCRLCRAQCTACERVIGKAAPFVNRLVLKERIWSKELAREIMDHVSSHSCSDDELFGSNSGELLQGCLSFMTDSFPRIREGLRRHLHPRYEEFGEDVSATEFCVDIGVCSQGLGHSLDRSLQRSQLLEEHRKRMQDL